MSLVDSSCVDRACLSCLSPHVSPRHLMSLVHTSCLYETGTGGRPTLERQMTTKTLERLMTTSTLVDSGGVAQWRCGSVELWLGLL